MNSQATHRGVAHWDVLSVTKDAVAERKNAQTTIAGLRSIFGSYDWLIREAIHVTKYLLDAMVTCKFCYQTGATRGVFDTNPATIKAHETTAAHIAAVLARAARQQDLGEVGVVVEAAAERQLSARTLIVGHLVANGMPYSARWTSRTGSAWRSRRSTAPCFCAATSTSWTCCCSEERTPPCHLLAVLAPSVRRRSARPRGQQLPPPWQSWGPTSCQTRWTRTGRRPREAVL